MIEVTYKRQRSAALAYKTILWDISMRIGFLFIIGILVIAVIAIMIFYFKNEESPHSIVLKLLTPMLIGIIWVIATIEDFDENIEEYFGGVIVLNELREPFKIIGHTISNNTNIQKLLPISFGTSNPDSNEEILRMIKGGIWLSILDSTGSCWNGKKIKTYAFNGASFHTRCGQEVTKVNVDKELFNLMLRNPYSSLDNNIIGFPKGTIVTSQKPSELIIKTPQIELGFTFSGTGRATISGLGSEPGTDSYEITKHAKNSHQGNLESFDFNIQVNRKINWRYQWSTQTKKQLQWSDHLIKTLTSHLKWEEYKEQFVEDLVRVNSKNINYDDSKKRTLTKVIVENIDDIKTIKELISKYLFLTYDQIDKNTINVEFTNKDLVSFFHILSYEKITFKHVGSNITIQNKS